MRSMATSLRCGLPQKGRASRGNTDAGVAKGGAGGAQSHGGLGFEALFAH